ncbi:DNA glycosylase [Halteromyces radiatus]|uniref:DNA glycosylase n=1 Tax=Halteromyces radiatus TaxID=101107 RepID=UPI00221F6BA9|nr:DNA glycosylase [Halteromyces radiatus]KAI8099065.1 DNA glycosylase [Halteromyces radiatus]
MIKKVPKFQSSKYVWFDLNTSPKELRLDTLRCGQSFRWQSVQDHWVCTLGEQLYLLKESAHSVFYGVPEDEAKNSKLVKHMDQTLRDYFQLELLSLEKAYERWSRLDTNFKTKAIHFQGIRMLRQDPWENLICFICSSNNNITRISQMVHKLCIHFGSKIATLDDTDYYGFPTLASLAEEGTESKLRQLGFGYRAKYIAQTAQKIKKEHPEQQEAWVADLRKLSYEETKQTLITLPGVGPKVADCICLMSMDHAEAIPVDTHVWQIAARDYGFGNKQNKTLTTVLYNQIGDHFRTLFGEHSGWAHSVLFSAELKGFEKRLALDSIEHSIVETPDTLDRKKQRIK